MGLVSLFGVARAADPPDRLRVAEAPPLETRPSPGDEEVPEASFRAVAGREVSVRFADRTEVRGQLLAVENGHFTISTDTGRIMTFAVGNAVDLRLVTPTRSTIGESGARPTDSTPSGVGIFTGFPLLTSGFDVEAGHFYGFVSTSILLPVIAHTNPLIYGFAVGAGGSFSISSESPWRFDAFAVVAPLFVSGLFDSNSTDDVIAFGVGVGLHATFESGLTVAIKVPILGYSLDNIANANRDASTRLIGFYLFTAASQPLLSFGYRW